MLIGSYLGNLGDKHRSAIPKKFLVELGSELVIAKWYEGCLILVNLEFWEKILGRLTEGTEGLKLGVREIERLVSYAGLSKDLVYVGLINRIEIWNKDIWDKKASELAKTTKEYIEEIGK